MTRIIESKCKPETLTEAQCYDINKQPGSYICPVCRIVNLFYEDRFQVFTVVWCSAWNGCGEVLIIKQGKQNA
jgi:hypothetical protein